MDSKQDNNKLRPMNDEQLPPELQWENMEAGIFHKMEALQAAASSDKNKKHRRRIWLVCLLLLGVLLSTLFLLNYEPASENTLDFTSSPAALDGCTDMEEKKEVSKVDQLPTTVTEQLTVAKLKATQAYVPQDNKQESVTAVEQNEEDSYAGNAVEIRETPSQDAPKLVSSEAFQQITDTKQASNMASAMRNTDDKPTIGSPNSALPTPVNQLVEYQVMIPVVSQTSKKEAALPIAVLPTEPSCPTFKTRSAQVWLTGGASWWRPGYGNTKPERAEFEQAILSAQGQFSYVQPVKKNLFLLIGLQYQQLESRLNWNTQIADYELTLEDTIIQIRRNVITGEESEIRGDVTLTVPAERQVQHFNSFSLLQVPLGIGKTWGKGRLQSHLLVGGVANLSFARRGRTLYQAELIDYDNSSSAIWTDKLSFSALCSGGLSYSITDRLGVVTVIQYQHSLSNWSTEEGITMRPSILNWSLGVNYSL